MSNLDFERSVAVVIGIDAYHNGIAPLRTAAADASAIAQTLQQDHGYDVILLLNEQANLHSLQALIQTKLPSLMAANSRLILYFAGHGIAQDGDDGPAGFLIPQDAKPGELNSYLPMVALHDALTALPCRHFLAIFDCCFAGAFRWSSTRDIDFVPEVIHRERYDRFRQDPAWQVITSASYDQKAMDVLALCDDRGEPVEGSSGHSPFAAALLEALKGAADAFPPAKNGQPAGDGVITATELYLYLRNSVEVLTEGQRKRQTPELCPLRNHDKGEFIFLTPGHTLNLPPAPELNKQNNPYRGLEAFEATHHELFFGRELEINQLLERLETPHPLTVVLGASGTGKSSLVRAGLLPRVAKRPDFQILPVVRPANKPLEALAQSVLDMTTGETTHEAVESLVQQFLAREDALSTLVSAWKTTHSGQKLLLVIDQTEELITQARSPEYSLRFQQLIKRVMADHWDVLWIVATLRLDFEAQFQDEALQDEWMDARFVLLPMGQAQLRAAIELPAAARVLYFEPSSLVDRLIEEVAQTPGALPLLSFTLSELYLRYLERRSDNRALTEADYRALGGVVGSLTKRATQEYDALVKADAAMAQTVKQVMLRMVAVEGGELARRRVPLSELVYAQAEENQRVQTLLDRLVAARLIVRGQAGDEGGAFEAYVEPAHDALVRGWDKLLRWKNEEQEGIALQRRLSPVAKEWYERSGKKASKTARGLLWNDNPRLGLLKEVAASKENWLNRAEAAFVTASFKLKRQRQVRFVGTLLGVIVSLSGLSVGLARVSEANARSNQRNFAGRLAADADRLMSKSSIKQQTGGLLAVYAHQLLQELGEESAAVNQVLRKSLEVLPVTQTFDEHRGAVTALAFSPDGTTLTTASTDGTARVWNNLAPSESLPSEGREGENATEGSTAAIAFNHGGKVSAIAIHPNGTTAVTASSNKTAKLWNLTTGETQATIEHKRPVLFSLFSPKSGQWVATASKARLQVSQTVTGKSVLTLGAAKPITAVRFSPDDTKVAMASEDGRVGLWEMATKQLIFSVDEAQAVTGLAFSPDGKRLAIAQQDGTAKIFNLTTKENTRTLSHRGAVKDVAFSPDGKWLATASYDETARVWNADTGDAIARFDHEDEVETVTFSPDGTQLATTSLNEAAQVWDIATSSVTETLSHTIRVNEVAFSPDGQFLATAGEDGTAKLWDTTSAAETRQLTHTATVRSVDFGSEDGGQVVTASNDGTVKIWDTATGTATQTFSHPGSVRSVSLSEAGDRIATASDDDVARVWDVATGETLFSYDHEDKLLSVRFSPDGQQIVTASADGKARVWAVTGKLVATLAHKGPVLSASFSPDGTQVATASSDKTAQVWTVASSQSGESVEQSVMTFIHTDRVREAVFSPDGTYLATASDNNGADVWDLATGERVFRPKHERWVSTVRFSPDGELLVTGSRDRTAKIWDLTGNLAGELTGAESRLITRLNHRRSVNTVSFSQSGDRVLTASADGSAIVWDVDTGRAITGLNHSAEVLAASFSPDGRLIATASKDGTAKVGGTDSAELAQRVCDRLQSNLAAEDWTRYIMPDAASTVEALSEYELICQAYLPHPSVAAAAQALASEGNIRPAIAIFRRVVRLSDGADLDRTTVSVERNPRAIARKFSAAHFVELAEEEAIYGNLEAARKLYEEAQSRDETVDLNPRTEAIENNPDQVAQTVSAQAEEELVFTAEDVAAEEAFVDSYFEDDTFEDDDEFFADTEDAFEEDNVFFEEDFVDGGLISPDEIAAMEVEEEPADDTFAEDDSEVFVEEETGPDEEAIYEEESFEEEPFEEEPVYEEPVYEEPIEEEPIYEEPVYEEPIEEEPIYEEEPVYEEPYEDPIEEDFF
ncbi:MAG: caspase family protein [Cyanobacteria bacterium J06560_6]